MLTIVEAARLLDSLLIMYISAEDGCNIFTVTKVIVNSVSIFYLELIHLFISYNPEESGWDTLWRTYKNELCFDALPVYRSSRDVVACLKKHRLKYEEHAIPNTFDITECFDPSSKLGQCLLNFMTAQDHFHQSLTPEIRAGILDLLRNKCSVEKDGKIFFNSNLSCMLVYA